MRSLVVILLASLAGGAAAEDYAAWPVLEPRFPSTGGGGWMIGEYLPEHRGDRCVTAFTATSPAGEVFRNVVEFDAVPTQGGVLCTNGRWRALEGDATGTTPLRVFLRDGIRRGTP